MSSKTSFRRQRRPASETQRAWEFYDYAKRYLARLYFSRDEVARYFPSARVTTKGRVYLTQ